MSSWRIRTEARQGSTRPLSAWSFSHLPIQEYLTAVWHSETEKPLDQLANKHLSDVRWREVFILAALNTSPSATASWTRPSGWPCQGLRLPQELPDLEGAALETLEGYLHACQLLVDCKSAATRCSNWEDICYRMLAASSSRAMASGTKGGH